MAPRKRIATKAQMLFECDRRPAQIEIGIGQKEGEYSLTFSLPAGLVQGWLDLPSTAPPSASTPAISVGVAPSAMTQKMRGWTRNATTQVARGGRGWPSTA